MQCEFVQMLHLQFTSVFHIRTAYNVQNWETATRWASLLRFEIQYYDAFTPIAILSIALYLYLEQLSTAV